MTELSRRGHPLKRFRLGENLNHTKAVVNDEVEGVLVCVVTA